MKTVTLNGEKELRIYALPLRQKIMKEMRLQGKPMTAKELADRLHIAPSSAQHHLKQLMSIGLVEPDHTEHIKGIRAHYLRLSPVSVSIGQQYQDVLAPSRDALALSRLMEIYEGYMQVVRGLRKNAYPKPPSVLNDIITGVMHLTPEDADELHRLLLLYLERHSAHTPDAHPWEFSFITYRADLDASFQKEEPTS